LTEEQNPIVDNVSERNARRTLRVLLSTYGAVILLTIAGFVVAWQFVEPAPPNRLVMATGSTDGAYYRFGLQYREILARYGVELELVNTAGTVENLEQLTDPASIVDCAFLQGTISSGIAEPKLYGIASLFFEPLWIFQREQVSMMVPDLRGRRIAVGEPGSGTQRTFRTILENNDLPVSAFEALELGGNAAADALLNGQVDVAVFVASEKAPYIRRLLLDDEIYLTPFIRADAYIRRYRSLASVILPRGVADLRRDIPPADIRLLAPVANLTVKEDVHPALVMLLVQSAVEVHSDGGLFEDQGQFPSVLNSTFPIHEDARRYLENGPSFLHRYLPFWIAVTIDRLLVMLIPLVTLLFPLFKIAPPTYRWRIRKRIYRHYRHLFEVETALLETPSAARLDQCSAQIERIERELAEVHVPLSYADQLYHLRMHVRFVKNRMEQARGQATIHTGPHQPPVPAQDR
jgi:TRAP transporter TAXI family solute receptor